MTTLTVQDMKLRAEFKFTREQKIYVVIDKMAESLLKCDCI